MKPYAPSFERLWEAVSIIARHADCPGKREVVAECMEEIEDCWSQGLLTLEQRFGLCAALVWGAASRRDRTLVTAV